MTLRQLQYFVAIVEAGSLTEAAERLLVSQPSLSQQMRALERELGGPLLERLPRGVRLTAAGRVLLPEAQAALRHSERGRRSVRMAFGLDARHVEVAVATSVAAGVFPTVLRDWQRRYDRIEVSLQEFPHRRALDEAVRDGAGDIGVGAMPEGWGGPVERLGSEEFVLVLPEGDELLASRSVRLAELAQRRWVHFAPSHGLAAVIDFCCASAGFAPRVAVRTSQVAAAPQFAATGLGPALVPSHIVPLALRHLTRPASPRLIRSVVAFSREDWTPLTSAFLQALRRYPWEPPPRGAVDLG